HNGHPVGVRTMGQYDHSDGGINIVETVEDALSLKVKKAENLFYCSQSTLSVDEAADVIDTLRTKFQSIEGTRKDDICYSTKNRQEAWGD
ncbi:4-hydroxy-3-methylbut-2-enyl diphosphate reductase, partial [Pseudoalteromonas sp. S558]